MTLQIQTFDIGCEPSPSMPAETVMANWRRTYLLFWASTKSIGQAGFLDDLGVAVLNCEDCVASKFGYPNDEGLQEHPFYNSGIAGLESNVFEVLGSPWSQEVTLQMRSSALRIWGGRGMDSSWSNESVPRHFILTLKEKTFECLASTLKVERYFPTFDEASAYVVGRMNES